MLCLYQPANVKDMATSSGHTTAREKSDTASSLYGIPAINDTSQGASTHAKGFSWTLVSQGAEARLFEGTFMGRQAVLKQRFTKKYRHPVLEQRLSSHRLIQEARCLHRCRCLGIHAPLLLHVDTKEKIIIMDKIAGSTVKAVLEERSCSDKMREQVAEAIGRVIGKLHGSGYVHGDLTTSNMIVSSSHPNSVERLSLIDFGLSSGNATPEDMAVDLYVLERAFLSTHPDLQETFRHIIQCYMDSHTTSKAALRKYKDVRIRGRKRVAFG
eukprot:gb/GECG01002896.1/.p1 GENE.gb/GECG01002896.1/~~gb/GECG01002896.1/.p1  ORF type:complete len:270 (+),score=20.20 gb/GECG01002896.1/:1-810(+)